MKNKFCLLLISMLVMLNMNVVFAACYGNDESKIDIIDWRIVELKTANTEKIGCIKVAEDGTECDELPDYRVLNHPQPITLENFNKADWVTEAERNQLVRMANKQEDDEYKRNLLQEIRTKFPKVHEIWTDTYISSTVIKNPSIRNLFSKNGSDIIHIYFDEEDIDLYKEVDYEVAEQYTKTQKAEPIYVELDPNGPATDVTEVKTTRIELFEGESLDNMTYSFFICKKHSKCLECGEYVAARSEDTTFTDGLSEYLKDARINDYCADHACLYFWTTCNTNNLSSEEDAHYFMNAPKGFKTTEGLECIEGKRQNKGENCYFCEDHTCLNDECTNPIIGVKQTDGKIFIPTDRNDADTSRGSIYDLDDRNFYSNYCIRHFCWEAYCQNQRSNPDASHAEKVGGDAVNFPQYCIEHNSDCTAYGCKNKVKYSDYEEDGRYLCTSCRKMAIEKVTCQCCGGSFQKELMYSYGDYIICHACYSTDEEEIRIDVDGQYIKVNPKDFSPNSPVLGGEQTGEGGGNGSLGGSGTGCAHEGYVPNSVTFENTSDSYHMQYWTCVSCGQFLSEEFSHVYENGVCVCGKFSNTGYGTGGGYSDYGDGEEEPEELATYIVSFDANGGKGKMADQEFTENVFESLSLNRFTKEGCTFVAWALKPDGEPLIPDGALCLPLTDITLYAGWEQEEYTVTFNSNGGKGKMDEQIFGKEEVLPLNANEFTKEGYKFVGWSTDKKGEVEYLDKEEILPEEDLTLYAIWEKSVSAVIASLDNWYLNGELDIEKSKITGIEIRDLETPKDYIKSWDASDISALNTVTAYLIDNENDTYKIIIVGNGSGSIIANEDSSDMFGNEDLENAFTNLTTILGLELLDTSEVRDMSNMFANCKALVSLDLSSFNTKNVMYNTDMFYGMNNLIKVTVGSKFDFKAKKSVAVLPIPDSLFISGADGKWHNSNEEAFMPEDVPSKLEDTYYASVGLISAI